MRTINEIIIHCTATPSNTSVASIKQYHVNVRKYQDIGYHYLITHDGKIIVGRPLFRVGAHCKSHNLHSIGIAWIGGKNGKRNITPLQKFALSCLVSMLVNWTSFKLDTISTHHYYNMHKSCPNYSLSELLPSIVLDYFKYKNE